MAICICTGLVLFGSPSSDMLWRERERDDSGRALSNKINSLKTILLTKATPMEPFPVIEQCEDQQRQNCTIQATDATNITCTALKYFPSMDLFFLHGSQKCGSKASMEWTNADGTNSKAIFTEARPSEIPYTCVAFNIPGSEDQRTATFSVVRPTLNDVTSPTLSITSTPGAPSFGKKEIIIVTIVPAIACVIAGIVLLCVFQRRKSRGDDRKLSFYELWMLVCTLYDNKSTNKLLSTFRALKISDIKEGFTRREAYEALCKWRMGNQRGKGSDMLKEALGLGGAERGREVISGIMRDTSKNVSPQILEHILWHVKDPKKFDRLIQVLTLDQSEERKPIKFTGKTGQDVRLALGELIKWSSCEFDVNPLVLLSLAMEEAGCKPEDALLLTVPDDLQAPVNRDQVKTFVNKLTGRHCRRLDLGSKVSSCQMDDIIVQNNNHLLNSSKIICEWLRESECSNYEKRCRLDDAIIEIGRHDLTDHFGTLVHRRYTGHLTVVTHPDYDRFDHTTIFDDDLDQYIEVVKPLSTQKCKELFNISANMDGAERNENMIKDVLVKWRDRTIALNQVNSVKDFKIIIDLLKDYSESALSDDEIWEALAFVFASKKEEDLSRKLGIDIFEQAFVMSVRGKILDKFRNPFIRKANRNINRNELREVLSCIGLGECIAKRNETKYVYEAELIRIAWDLLMGDILPLMTLLSIKPSKITSHISIPPALDQRRCTVDLLQDRMIKTFVDKERDREDFCGELRKIGFLRAACSTFLDYGISLSELMDIMSCIGDAEMKQIPEHIGLSEEDVKRCQDEEGKTDRLKLMLLWKQQIRPVSYHFRLEIAVILRKAGLNSLCEKVVTGCFRKTTPHPLVVQDICTNISDEKMAILCDLKGLEKKGNRNDLDAHVSGWLNDWMEAFDPMNETSMKYRRDVNDALFRNGFYQLAVEIIALENNG
ncbi:uncharacterized protein LOC135155802 [Lytechinus pictus]|uniref:uncharacterized protein LOC135155802 n=1 Tax=Lytechinus pictus TaxID=7653 RepID=UPI0030BA1ED0